MNQNQPPARCIVADPPWNFGDKLPGDSRGAAKNYKTLELHDIMRFPLPPIAEPALLCLWRVAAMPQEALDVLKAWGFTIKSEIVWVKKLPSGKTAFGMGHYVRGAHEVCLLATRGGRFHVKDKSVRSIFETHVIEAPLGEHSEKPQEFFDLVERLSGEGPFVELFARKGRPGWHSYGDELPGGYIWTPADPNAPKPTTEPEASISPTPEVTSDVTTIVPRVLPTDGVLVCPSGERVTIPTTKLTAEEVIGIIHTQAPKTLAHVLKDGRVALELRNEQNGELPAHVITDLGYHPLLCDAPLRTMLLAKAIDDGIIGAERVNQDAKAAWIELQYKAPPGWFKGTREPARCGEYRTIGDMVSALAARGCPVNLVEFSQWPAADRDAAERWLEKGGVAPPAVDKIMREACVSCAEGRAVGNGAPHTGKGFACVGEGKRATVNGEPVQGPDPETRAEAPAPAKGRRTKKPKCICGAEENTACPACHETEPAKPAALPPTDLRLDGGIDDKQWENSKWRGAGGWDRARVRLEASLLEEVAS